MPTDAQIAANRKNSRSSKGPATAEGKAASSRNSFQHGLSSAALILLPYENAQHFIDLASGLRAEHKPLTVTEDLLVAKMAQSQWLSMRAVNLQSMVIARSLQVDQKLLSLYIRYQRLHDRAFFQSFAELQKLRKDARQQRIGFVSQRKEEQLHLARIRNLNARSEALETVTHVQKLRNAPLFAAASASEVEQTAV